MDTETNPSSINWRRFMLPVAVLLPVIAWLAIQWPHQSLWYDETLTAWVASGPADRLWWWCTQVDIQVPLHYLVLRGWMALVGNSEFALHLLSTFCGLFAVAGLVALARRLTGRRVALIAGLLMGFSPGFVWVAYEVRAYALALALYAWACVLLHEMLKPTQAGRPPRRWLIVAYAALMLGALYTHYTAIGGLAAHFIIVAWTVWRTQDQLSRRILLRRMVMAAVIIGVGFAPWLPVLLSRGGADRSYYAGAILPQQTLGVIFSFNWLARDDFRWLTVDNKIGPLVFPVATRLLLFVAGILMLIVRRRRRGASLRPLLYGLSIILLPSLMVAVVVYFKPKLAGRYAWPAWIGIDLLVAMTLVAFASLIRRGRGNGAGGLTALPLAVLVIALPWLTGQVGHPPDSDFRGAFAAIQQEWQPSDLVILRDGTLFTAADYYHSPQPILGLPDALLTDATHILHAAEAVPILRQQPDSVRGVWLLAWQGDVMDPENVTAGLLETIGKQQGETRSFGDVSLTHFALDHPLSALQLPDADNNSAPLLTTSEGLALASASIVPALPGHIVIESWWERLHPISSNARVSIRLIGPDGTTRTQIDQPPAGWVYFPDRWPDNTLILGRYDLLRPGTDPLTVKLVVYSAANDFAPVEVTVGNVP